ncbi:MAG: hypothetical protein KDD45_10955 [Bdellovibrionales bacterium]|nr:hypothetical protein [Bdellovibrionales bacterium]
MSVKKLEFYIKASSLFRVPLLFFCRPKLLSIQPTAKARIPLFWATRNHYGSMYFGALSMGAELSVALPLLEEIFLKNRKVNFLFKDFQAEFLKRADDDVIFEFQQVNELIKFIDECETQNTRLNKTFSGKAYSNSTPDKIYMTYNITLSIKPSTKPLS